MKTRPDERLPYLELARRGARVERSIPATALSRLSAIAPARGELHVQLAFHLDQDGFPWVAGQADVVLGATCQGCLEQIDQRLQVSFEVCIVEDPQTASDLAERADVLVAQGSTLSIAEIVEDELILSVPERLCPADPCPYAPPLEYPAAGATAPARDNPFKVLTELKQR